MPIYFADSSALVKKYRNELGSHRVIDLLKGASRIIISRLTLLEVSAALVRRGSSVGSTNVAVAAALDELDRNAQSSFDVGELDGAVIGRATLLTRQYGLRAADAIQLASALLARDEVRPFELTFLASGKELNAAALVEGLLVLDPAGP